MSVSRIFTRVAAVTTGAAGLVLASGALASAHITVTPSSTAAGGYTVLTFSNGHGCDGSPTSEVTFEIPEQIIAVTPTLNPNWTVDKVMQKLQTPVDDGHGGQYTERVGQVVYTAKMPQPDGYRDTFALSLQLPDAEGDKLVFPVIQTCEKGETAWTQTYEEGQDEPDTPAPFLTVTAAEGDAHGATHDASETAEADETEDSSSSSMLGWAGVVFGALGLGAGGAALARGRQSA